MTDQEILQLFRNNSTRDKAFSELVKVYSKKLYWHVRRMVTDHDDANDVVQNAFIKIWKGLPNFKEESALYTWLYRIASNEAITFINLNKKRSSVQLATAEYDLGETIQDEVWMDSEAAIKKLQLAIEALPDKQRQVFVMRYYDEMKYEEMQAILGTSVGALKASFHHAVKKVENFLTVD
ncbi:MAG: RNA polymerase sigma factor [Fimbriimonadaceae bacterium]|nr:RNA polymerase sigma factor [Chitinophagales bacterium]